jgi:FMN phosphatase YigB (HAD superfamily)
MSRRTGGPEEDLRRWYFDRYMPRMCGILKGHYRPRPGAAELLAGLTRRGFPWAVYSDYPLTAERLAALGLEPPPEGRLYGPERFGAQKPAARPFLSIAADLGHPPERILVVGDSPDTDGAGAAAAGMAYIGIGKPGKGEALLRWEALVSLLREGLLPA